MPVDRTSSGRVLANVTLPTKDAASADVQMWVRATATTALTDLKHFKAALPGRVQRPVLHMAPLAGTALPTRSVALQPLSLVPLHRSDDDVLAQLGQMAPAQRQARCRQLLRQPQTSDRLRGWAHFHLASAPGENAVGHGAEALRLGRDSGDFDLQRAAHLSIAHSERPDAPEHADGHLRTAFRLAQMKAAFSGA